VIVRCPECGEDEALRGRRDDELILVTCETCGHAWDRDLVPRCDRCGSEDIVSAPKAFVEKSRGTQLSVVAVTTIQLCRSCDAETLEEYLTAPGTRLVMPDELPTTAGDATDAHNDR